MIKPDEFYTHDDTPGPKIRAGLWQRIRTQAEPLRTRPWIIADTRSFIFGMAATVIAGLATVGAWTLGHQLFDNAQPQPLRLERAYVSAINEFENVLPIVTTSLSQAPRTRDALTERSRQLSFVDAAIRQLRLQTNGTDMSPLIRERQRQLYAMKLRILQQMIEQGDIEP
jgi:hypothetical protein